MDGAVVRAVGASLLGTMPGLQAGQERVGIALSLRLPALARALLTAGEPATGFALLRAAADGHADLLWALVAAAPRELLPRLPLARAEAVRNGHTNLAAWIAELRGVAA